MIRHPRPLAMVFVAAIALLIPVQTAYACWELCVARFGTYRDFDGVTHRLDHCIERWPDGSNRPITTCVYAPT